MKAIIKLSLVSLFSLSLFTSFCQIPNFCGTVPDSNSIFRLVNGGQKPENLDPKVFKVYFYSVIYEDGTEKVSEQEIDDALASVNADFNPHNIFFERDCAVEYLVMPDEQVTNDRYYVDVVFNGDCYKDDGIKVFIGPSDHNSEGANAFTIGGIPTNLIWMTGMKFGVRHFKTKVLSHEFGHCLGLHHTFWGTVEKLNLPNECCELVNGSTSNREDCGDFVYDTEADPYYWSSQDPQNCQIITFRCPNNAFRLGDPCFFEPYDPGCLYIRDAQGVIYTPPYDNLMSYQDYNLCSVSFTTGQGERMHGVIEESALLQNCLKEGEEDCCCPVGSVVLNNINLSEAINLGLIGSSGTDYCVKGKFIIDQNVNFENSDFIIESCVDENGIFIPGEVVIAEGVSANFNNCTFEGCETMWKGISIESLTKVNFQNSTIKDAYHGIDGKPSSNLSLSQNCLLVDNHVGIYGQSMSNLSIRSTTFNFDVFKPPYDGMPSIRERTWAGIEIFSSQIVSNRRTTGLVSNSCNFFNLFNGILANNSDIHITFPRFENISSKVNAFFFPEEGYGIKAIGNSNTIYVSGYGKTAPLKTFKNVTCGLFLSGMSINRIQNCNMENVEYGICAINSRPYGNGSFLSNNQIESYNCGIALIGNLQTTMNVSKNSFLSYFGGGDLHFPWLSAGTYVSPYIFFQTAPNRVSTLIENNTYDVYTAEYGIRVLDGINVFVQGHNDKYYVKLHDPVNNIAGISFEGVEGGGATNYIGYNTVVGTEESNASAIQSINSEGLTIECNFTDSTFNGFEYDGNHLDIVHKTNNTLNHDRGLYLNRFAVIGEQENAGNTFGLFCDPNSPTGCAFLEGLCDNDFPLISRFTIAPGLGQNDPLRPNPVDPPLGEWFEIDNNILITQTCELPENPPPPPPPPGGCEYTDHDYWVAADTMIYSEYGEGRKFISQQMLYDKILRDSCFEVVPTEIETFYLNNQNSIIGKLSDIDEQIKGLFPSSENLGLLESLNNNISENLVELFLADSIIVDGNPIDSANAIFKKDSLLTILDSLFVSRDSLNDVYYSLDTSIINNIISTNNNINTESSYPGTNQKVVNNILLNALKNDTIYLDSVELVILDQIAKECPEMGGLSVFQARNLISLFKGDVYEEYTCDNPGYERKFFKNSEEEINIDFSLFPNPTDGEITVLFKDSDIENRKVEFELFNIVGDRINFNLKYTQPNQINISLDSNPKGLYILVVKVNGEKAGVRKVVLSD